MQQFLRNLDDENAGIALSGKVQSRDILNMFPNKRAFGDLKNTIHANTPKIVCKAAPNKTPQVKQSSIRKPFASFSQSRANKDEKSATKGKSTIYSNEKFIFPPKQRNPEEICSEKAIMNDDELNNFLYFEEPVSLKPVPKECFASSPSLCFKTFKDDDEDVPAPLLEDYFLSSEEQKEIMNYLEM